MARKKRDKKAPPAGEPVVPRPGGGGGSVLYWGGGFALAAAGYFSLTKADPAGQNFWAWTAAVCLLSGYLLFIPAIIATYRR